MNCVILLVLLQLFYFSLNTISAAPTFTIDNVNNQFLRDGKPFRYISGDFAYFKIPSALWRDRLLKYKAAGLNAIQSYINWNGHEPEKGLYKFYGDQDFVKFFKLAQELGFVVVLRPGPFINAELDMGGLPYWLLTVNKNMKIRTMEKTYLAEVEAWLKVLLPMIKPLLYQNGGPIIMVQIENEYGFWPALTHTDCDYQYMSHLRDTFRSYLGNETILFTTDGWEFVKCGKVDQVFSTVDFGSMVDPKKAFQKQRDQQASGPFVNSEYYPGWINRWGMPYEKVETKQVAETLDAILALNASVNIYPVAGGTLFGFNSGGTHANQTDFHPVVTSYEFDGPITEAGDLNEKYDAIRKVIGKYVTLTESVPKNSPKMQSPVIHLHGIASIFDLLAEPISSSIPQTFEELKIAHGFVLYSTTIKNDTSDPVVLTVPHLRDRAQVFIDKQYKGTLSRTQEIYSMPLSAKNGSQLDLFVENQGRFAFLDVAELKGIIEGVKLGETVLHDFKHYLFYQNWTTAISDLEKKTTQIQAHQNIPTFFTGTFQLADDKSLPLDTFLRVDGFSKGNAFLNGFNLGRYWPKAGPQITLYAPAHLFRPYPQQNRLTLFELEQHPCEDLGRCNAKFVDVHVLNATTAPI
jgi:beta-galactosidase